MPPGVLAHRADGATGTMVFLHNLGTAEATVDLGTLAEEAEQPNDVLADQEYGPVGKLDALELAGYGYRWIRLRRELQLGSGCLDLLGLGLAVGEALGMSGRVAIVTGAARGIGAATARRLAADGWRWPWSTSTRPRRRPLWTPIVAAGGRAVGVGADVADRAQVEAAVARVAAELGPPTVLVNNAGVIRDNLMFKMTDDDWDTVMAVHLRGAFLMRPGGAEAHGGRQVGPDRQPVAAPRRWATGARPTTRRPRPGLQGLTKTLAIELGPFGVTANAVAPGFIVTDMTAATAERMGVDFETFQKARAPSEIAGAAGRARRTTSRTRSRSWSGGGRLRQRPGHLRRRRPARLSCGPVEPQLCQRAARPPTPRAPRKPADRARPHCRAGPPPCGGCRRLPPPPTLRRNSP